MILVDVNLLVFAQNTDSPFHAAAKVWWESELHGETPIGLAWVTVLAFIRLTTNPKALKDPLSSEASLKLMHDWLSLPNVRAATPGPRHWEIFSRLISQHGLRGSSVTDAHLAALAIENGWTLYAADEGFGRFRDLQWRNPLALKQS